MKGSWKGGGKGKKGKSVFQHNNAPQDTGDEPPRKRKKVEHSLEELRERLAKSLEAGVLGQFKSDLNIILMTLLRRPLAKGDVAVSLERGPPDVLQLSIPLLNLTVEQTFDEQLKVEARKEAEANLAAEAMQEMVRGIDAGEITMPEEAAPPADPDAAPTQQKGPAEVKADDFKSQLNTALQRLLGRATTKEDRIFKVSMAAGTGEFTLPNLNPPVNVSCAIDENEETPFLQMSASEKQKVQTYVEHQLASMALSELEASGRLVYDPSQPTINCWQLPQNAGGGHATKKRPLVANPPPVQQAETQRTEPPLIGLRRLQESFEHQAPGEYSEHIVCQPGEHSTLMWCSTLALCGPMTNWTRVEGYGESSTRPKAQEQAATHLLSQVDAQGGGKGGCARHESKGKAAAAPKGFAKGVGRQPPPGRPAQPQLPPPGKGKAWIGNSAPRGQEAWPPAQKGKNGKGKAKW